VLHFYPGDKRVVWMVGGKIEVSAEAWGGEEPAAGAAGERMRPQRTTPGRFVIHSYAPYRTRSWDMAKIQWGAELKVERTKENQKRVLYRTGLRHGAWRPVQSLIPWLTYDLMKKFYGQLYGDSGYYDANRDGIPDKWIFNEFGPLAVRYFRDLNNNRVLDEDEHLSGEMIHTIPLNEAQDLRGRPVTFTVSHGCIHIAPTARTRLRDGGAFDRGTTFIVHRYDEHLPRPQALLPDLPAPAPPTAPLRLAEEKTFLDLIVVDDDDKPLGGLRYKLELPDGTTETGKLGSDAHLGKRNIDAGDAKFTILPDEAKPAADEDESASNDDDSADDDAGAETLDVPENQVAVRLVDINGDPIADQAVSIKLADGSTRSAVTDADGRVSLSPVPPGDCVVTIA
jgi:hypothetical protein